MSCILNIETSTSVCSVAASQDGQTIFVKEDLKGPSHAVSLGVFVDEALSFIDSHAIPLDAVAVKLRTGFVHRTSDRSVNGKRCLLRAEYPVDRYPYTGGFKCSCVVAP